jgi:hypothetical protein
MTTGGWREQLFVPGRKYHVLKDWSERGSRFKAGTVVKYEYCGYVPHDNESQFLFSQSRGLFRRRLELTWRIRDEESDLKVREYFREVQSH